MLRNHLIPHQADAADVDRMVDRLLFVGPEAARKRSAFWVLLTLAAVIASAGIITDSAATVIGAMIVAPLMTPILGTALAIVLARQADVVRSIATVLSGALLVIAIGYGFGVVDALGAEALTNPQITGRTNPRLIDLVAALATGTVGAFALVRSDISDTLPGVAIAISLVPPLAVVGLLLEARLVAEALGALLLFGTNVTAIIATGCVVLLAYGIRDAAEAAGSEVGSVHGRNLATIALSLVLLLVPLGVGSHRVANDRLEERQATPIVTQWAQARGWQVVSLDVTDTVLRVEALGPPPRPEPSTLRAELDAAGLDITLVLDLIVGNEVVLEPGEAGDPAGSGEPGRPLEPEGSGIPGAAEDPGANP